MTKTSKKMIVKNQLKMKIAAKSPVAIRNAPAPHRSSSAKEGGPIDISTLDHASGLSGMPTPAGQK